MTSNNQLPPGYCSEQHGVAPAGDSAVEPSRKKQRTENGSSSSNATSSNDGLDYQSMASLLAKKLLNHGCVSDDESETTKILVTEIKEDSEVQGKLRELYKEKDNKEKDNNELATQWATQLTKLGFQLYIKGLKRDNEGLKRDNEEFLRKTTERWIKLSKMEDEGAKNELDMYIGPAPGATNSSHVRTKHKTTTSIEEADFKLGEIPLLTELMPEEAPKLISHVLTSIIQGKDHKKFEYQNEADILLHVGRALDDALPYMNALLKHYNRSKDGTSIELTYRTECNMFSNKPDHYVMSTNYQKFNVVFPVEVKKEHENVFTSDSVASQVFNYTMLQKMLTGRPSLAVLTSFNESKIVWDPDCTVAEIEDRFALDNVEKTVNSVINSITNSNPPPPPPANDYKTPETTPKNVREPMTDSPPELVEAKIKEEADTRRLMYSKKTYSPYQLLSVLCNVAIASLHNGLNKIKIQTGDLQKGQTILVLKGKGGRGKMYEWRTLLAQVKVTGSWTDFEDKQYEYLARTIVGEGSTSRCWGAVVVPDIQQPNVGFSCVIKYWIKVWDKNKKKHITQDQIQKESREKTGKEVENYKKIYYDLFFKGRCCVAQKILNNRSCVILPFFKQIEKGDRQTALKDVERVLLDRFYDENKGISYQFKKSDQRWSHIGRWMEPDSEPGSEQKKTHLVLFDLADLEIKKTTKILHEVYVKEHIERLQKRLQPEKD